MKRIICILIILLMVGCHHKFVIIEPNEPTEISTNSSLSPVGKKYFEALVEKRRQEIAECEYRRLLKELKSKRKSAK